MKKFHFLSHISIIIFILVFLSTILLKSEIVFAWGCGVLGKNVWWDSSCSGASPSNPIGGSEGWKDFGPDVLGGGTACAIGESSQWHPPSGYYQYEYICVESKPGKETDHCVKWEWRCIFKADVVWKYIGIGNWPVGGEEGNYCKVRYAEGVNPCGGQWGWWPDKPTPIEQHARWDPDENGCVACSSDGKQLVIHYCSSGPFTTSQTCEEACGADSRCDEQPVDKVIGYDDARKPIKCDSSCQAVSTSCMSAGCLGSDICCASSGSCIPPAEYCGPANTFPTEGGKNTCYHNQPYYKKDYCDETCRYTKDSSLNFCTSDQKGCSGDSSCEGKKPGDWCAEGSFCTNNCSCVYEPCNKYGPTGANGWCSSKNPAKQYCCGETGLCLPLIKYCGEPGTSGTFGNANCCKSGCGYGVSYVTTQKGGPICGCDATTCPNGYCQSGDDCFYNVKCFDNGGWIGNLLNNKPSCDPRSLRPCENLQKIVVDAFGSSCKPGESYENYNPVADTNKDNKIDIKDLVVGNEAWCKQQLQNTTNSYCGITSQTRMFCLHSGSAQCTKEEGWKCNYMIDDTCNYVTCSDGYYQRGSDCYHARCEDSGWEKDFWCSLNSGCSGDILLYDGSCAPTGCVFKTFDCDYFSGSRQEGCYEDAYVVYDYYCIDGMCDRHRIYDSLITFVSVNDKPAYTLVGDINGDKKVDIKDLVLVIKYYGAHKGSAKWNDAMSYGIKPDLNCDDKVDIKDLVLLIKNYGKFY
jgi:hypothetical protein